MSQMRTGFASLALAAAVTVGDALAETQQILGERLLLKDPTGAESSRSLVIGARERGSDITAIAGDPVAGGGTLLLGINSGSTGQSFVLDASGWSATATGFRYAGPTGSDGDPVKQVVLRRSRRGTALLKIVLKGKVGVQPLDLVPPDPGSDAVAILVLSNGDSYCVSFGGAAGGEVVADTATTWKMQNATAEPGCPTFCCSFGSSCVWGRASEASFCPEVGGVLGFPGRVCDGTTGACAPPPAGVGNCCTFAGGSLCFGGPGVQQPPCDEISGSFTTGAICDPTGGCVVP
jgi:hypothetical protein